MNEKPVEWIEYLRAHPREKGKGALEKIVGGRTYRCCLGALCHLEEERLGLNRVKSDYGDIYYNKASGYLPQEVVNEYGFRSSDPAHQDAKGNWRSLVDLNDGRVSWSKIADIIEEHWEEL